jgi:hypothetical protein
VVGYTIFWGILLLLEFISYAVDQNRVSRSLVTAVAYGFSFRGLWSLGIILYTNWADLSWAVLSPFRSSIRENLVEDCLQEGLLLKPHLNSALRAEILFFTTQGIMFAASAASQDDSNPPANSNSDDLTTEQDVDESSDRKANAPRKSFGFDRLSLRLSFKSNQRESESSSNTFAFKDKMDFSSGSGRHLLSHQQNSSSSAYDTARKSIVKLNESQSIACAGERVNEAQDQAHRLGIDILSASLIHDIETGTTRSSTVAHDIIRHHQLTSANANTGIKSTIAGNKGSSSITSSSTTTTAAAAATTSPFHATRNNSTSSNISSASDPGYANNPAVMEMIMQHPSGTSPKAPVRTRPQSVAMPRPVRNISSDTHDSTDSVDSRITRKWNDATDIEFKMSHSDLSSQDRPTIKASSITSRPTRSTITAEDGSSMSAFAYLSYLCSSFFDNINNAALNAASVIGNSEYDEFKFKDFNPMEFARLREIFGFSAEVSREL